MNFCVYRAPQILASKALLYFGDSKVTDAYTSEKHVPSYIIQSGTTTKFKNEEACPQPFFAFSDYSLLLWSQLFSYENYPEN